MGLSPMMEHYLAMKEKYKDCVLFYRLGDFYEMFFDDAVRVSKLLDLTLTGRDCGLKERAPMCGIPYHAADSYIAKLVSMGERVAICEQLTEPTAGKGMVERDVIRVVSAGTVIEVYATSLHYAPCGIDGAKFRCVVVLPRGTNLDLEHKPTGEGEDRLLFARNKWLIAHPDAKIEGAFNGLYGENLTV